MVSYTLYLDGDVHDGSILELKYYEKSGTYRIVPRQDMSLDEYYIINDIYLFELVGRLSSSDRRGAYL